jgi:hypothetical protein
MTRDEAITEFRAIVARYGSCQWLSEVPAEVFQRLIELTEVLVEADKG